MSIIRGQRSDAPDCGEPLIWHISQMLSSKPEPETARDRLVSQIDQAISTSEELGATLVACYLQMARDMIDTAGIAMNQTGSARAEPKGSLEGQWE